MKKRDKLMISLCSERVIEMDWKNMNVKRIFRAVVAVFGVVEQYVGTGRAKTRRSNYMLWCNLCASWRMDLCSRSVSKKRRT